LSFQRDIKDQIYCYIEGYWYLLLRYSAPLNMIWQFVCLFSYALITFLIQETL